MSQNAGAPQQYGPNNPAPMGPVNQQAPNYQANALNAFTGAQQPIATTGQGIDESGGAPSVSVNSAPTASGVQQPVTTGQGDESVGAPVSIQPQTDGLNAAPQINPTRQPVQQLPPQTGGLDPVDGMDPNKVNFQSASQTGGLDPNLQSQQQPNQPTRGSQQQFNQQNQGRQQALANQLRGRPEGAPSYMKYGRPTAQNSYAAQARGPRRGGSPNIFGGANRRPVAQAALPQGNSAEAIRARNAASAQGQQGYMNQYNNTGG
jgi:hypothetical protein